MSRATGWLPAFFDMSGTARVVGRTIGFRVPAPALLEEARRHPATLGVGAGVSPHDRPPSPRHSPRLMIRRLRNVCRFV